MRQIADILGAIMPEVRELDDDETLTYLHGCISTKRHYVRTPDTPAYLDAFLCDDDFQGGLFPRLGGQFMRTISVRAYPTTSSPGLLDRLNELGVSLPMDLPVHAARQGGCPQGGDPGAQALVRQAQGGDGADQGGGDQGAVAAGGSRRHRQGL